MSDQEAKDVYDLRFPVAPAGWGKYQVDDVSFQVNSKKNGENMVVKTSNTEPGSGEGATLTMWFAIDYDFVLPRIAAVIAVATGKEPKRLTSEQLNTPNVRDALGETLKGKVIGIYVTHADGQNGKTLAQAGDLFAKETMVDKLRTEEEAADEAKSTPAAKASPEEKVPF